MSKFISVFIFVLLLIAWGAEAWAHNPYGGRYGSRGTGFKLPRYVQPLYPKPRTSFRHHRGLTFGYHRHHRHGYRYPNQQRRILPRPRLLPRSQRVPRLENGILYSHPGPLKYKPFSSPIAKAYEQGWGVSPFMKAREKKARQQFSNQVRSFHHRHHPPKSADPWFLYGKGKQLRQMGVLPTYP